MTPYLRHSVTPAPGSAGAIIVAGGSGRRFGGPVPKQYLLLSGRPVLAWSVRAFANTPEVAAIVVVVPAADVRRVRRMLKGEQKVCAVVAGGAERRDSVRHGLADLPPEIRWVAVHDAVRPLITVATIEATLLAAKRCRAALAACPSRDTVKISDAAGFVKASPDRSTVWQAQTPQTFERALLEKAHVRGRTWPVTDDAQMVERLGVRVKLVASPVENLKITTPADLALARLILKRRRSFKTTSS